MKKLTWQSSNTKRAHVKIMYTAEMHTQFSTMSMVLSRTVLQQQIGEPHIMVHPIKKKKVVQQLL